MPRTPSPVAAKVAKLRAEHIAQARNAATYLEKHAQRVLRDLDAGIMPDPLAAKAAADLSASVAVLVALGELAGAAAAEEQKP